MCNFSAYFSHDDLPKYLIIIVNYKTLDFQSYNGYKYVKLYIIFSTLFAVDYLIVFLKTKIIACKNLDIKLVTES